jgi:hypothetical protein
MSIFGLEMIAFPNIVFIRRYQRKECSPKHKIWKVSISFFLAKLNVDSGVGQES